MRFVVLGAFTFALREEPLEIGRRRHVGMEAVLASWLAAGAPAPESPTGMSALT